MPASADARARAHVLWWGRFDPDYPRNRVLRKLLADLGYASESFRPRWSRFGNLEASLHKLPSPGLVWVPCFRQRDLDAARRWSRSAGIPLLFDPLISAWDKQVFERAKLREGSARAERLRAWESGLLNSAERVLVDTPAHADYFAERLGVDPDKLAVVHVGAEEEVFVPTTARAPARGEPLELLFFGSFIALQAPQVIVEAARRYRGSPVRWCLLGDGPLRAECEALASGLDNVAFESPVAYQALPGRIARAHVLLGVFGAGAKTQRVIPNKVFQSLASARPVITARAEGYPTALREDPSSGIAWVAPGDPDQLARAVAKLAGAPASLAAAGKAARASYLAYFSNERIRDELRVALQGLVTP